MKRAIAFFTMTDISELLIELAAARLEIERLQEFNDDLCESIRNPKGILLVANIEIEQLRKYNRTLKDLVIVLLKTFPD